MNSIKRIAYSCVVDASPKFEWQAFILVQSLLRNTDCNPVDIKVHCLPGISESFQKVMIDLKVTLIHIQPFITGFPYCNKLSQCFSGAFSGYDKIIMVDCDVFFLSFPDIPIDAIFAAKIVDTPTPPLNVLQVIYQAAGLQATELIPATTALSVDEVTFKGYFNGGLYYVDTNILITLG